MKEMSKNLLAETAELKRQINLEKLKYENIHYLKFWQKIKFLFKNNKTC